MAVYALINPGRPIENGLAVGRFPDGPACTQAPTFWDASAEKLVNMDPYQAIINGRFKIGASGGWERPGSDFA